MKKLPFHLQLVRGALGKKIVIKHYKKNIVMTRYPDMTGIRPSNKQQACRILFAKAVAYARRVLKDAVQRERLVKRIKKGKCIYHAAIQEYLLIVKGFLKHAQSTGVNCSQKTRPFCEIMNMDTSIKKPGRMPVFILSEMHLYYPETG